MGMSCAPERKLLREGSALFRGICLYQSGPYWPHSNPHCPEQLQSHLYESEEAFLLGIKEEGYRGEIRTCSLPPTPPIKKAAVWVDH